MFADSTSAYKSPNRIQDAVARQLQAHCALCLDRTIDKALYYIHRLGAHELYRGLNYAYPGPNVIIQLLCSFIG